eukprot:TRINITY_DN10310_c0_g2_i1.p1 TRINITY_DN10310_c0_g2~~TRINITY_DN10310_c0_g2_i1.p1  ORF type:complete len:312 (+),score=27.25 TRINITY_DN10310_c0_g2_i1:49-984(+)
MSTAEALAELSDQVKQVRSIIENIAVRTSQLQLIHREALENDGPRGASVSLQAKDLSLEIAGLAKQAQTKVDFLGRKCRRNASILDRICSNMHMDLQQRLHLALQSLQRVQLQYLPLYVARVERQLSKTVPNTSRGITIALIKRGYLDLFSAACPAQGFSQEQLIAACAEFKSNEDTASDTLFNGSTDIVGLLRPPDPLAKSILAAFLVLQPFERPGQSRVDSWRAEVASPQDITLVAPAASPDVPYVYAFGQTGRTIPHSDLPAIEVDAHSQYLRRARRRRKRALAAIAVALLLVAAVVGIAVGVVRAKN